MVKKMFILSFVLAFLSACSSITPTLGVGNEPIIAASIDCSPSALRATKPVIATFCSIENR